MGYTHYWTLHDREAFKRSWPQLVKDIQLIVGKAGVAISGAENINENDDVCINGERDEHEDFHFGPGMDMGFNCCKTARKEYDLVVCAVLLRATQVLLKSTLDVRSDGVWDEEWKDAAHLVRQLWPYDLIECPWLNEEEIGTESPTQSG